MKNIINHEWFISTTLQGKVLDLIQVKEYGRYLQLVLDLSPITIKNYMSSLERFWIWSLAVTPMKNESFHFYLSRYRQEIKKGFTIYDSCKKYKIKIPILKLKPKMQSTIDNEISNLKVFFNWLYENDKTFNLNKNTINWYYEFQRKMNSKHYSYISQNINKLSLERLSKKESLIAKPKKRIMYVDKAFPYEHFLELVSIAKPREKLLYLLMGGTSARISQALNLTIYDIDYESMNVYLSDPTIDDKNQLGYLGISRKKWLYKNYHIDAKNQPPHNTVQFKYPIPSRANKPLFWINEEVKCIFFETLIDYNIYPEYLRQPKHPFFFTTKNGTRLLYKPAYNEFKNNCFSLARSIGCPELIELGPHSLRHMWGNYMAEIYYLASLKKIPAEVERIRLYTQYGLGHSDNKATDTYFNAKMDKVLNSGDKYFAHYIREDKHLPVTLFIKGLLNENG